MCRFTGSALAILRQLSCRSFLYLFIPDAEISQVCRMLYLCTTSVLQLHNGMSDRPHVYVSAVLFKCTTEGRQAADSKCMAWRGMQAQTVMQCSAIHRQISRSSWWGLTHLSKVSTSCAGTLEAIAAKCDNSLETLGPLPAISQSFIEGFRGDMSHVCCSSLLKRRN